MLVGSVCALGLCHCYLNLLVATSFPFSMTSWVEVAKPIRDHMNHRISVVALNYSHSSHLLGPFFSSFQVAEMSCWLELHIV